MCKLKKSQEVSEHAARAIEQITRDQLLTTYWFNIRRSRITASRFGEVCRRKAETPSDALVLNLLSQNHFTLQAANGVSKMNLQLS